ncbi:hypothetical protein BKP37_12810 [Anaerobacillus alkalilacustris]|uniref:Uncharacterized protein n=1 Tax=Anaerobacillus alkalilacustris TaxID=393763 RepID=A0A1S2LLW4_9BACI|nr:hypothetical protein [Anaerobacillus alkalilacustris]OIJ12677.1 hypothetical protein BKP37_12810 [Anaerobacillus alkalilacustris]
MRYKHKSKSFDEIKETLKDTDLYFLIEEIEWSKRQLSLMYDENYNLTEKVVDGVEEIERVKEHWIDEHRKVFMQLKDVQKENERLNKILKEAKWCANTFKDHTNQYYSEVVKLREENEELRNHIETLNEIIGMYERIEENE